MRLDVRPQLRFQVSQGAFHVSNALRRCACYSLLSIIRRLAEAADFLLVMDYDSNDPPLNTTQPGYNPWRWPGKGPMEAKGLGATPAHTHARVSLVSDTTLYCCRIPLCWHAGGQGRFGMLRQTGGVLTSSSSWPSLGTPTTTPARRQRSRRLSARSRSIGATSRTQRTTTFGSPAPPPTGSPMPPPPRC